MQKKKVIIFNSGSFIYGSEKGLLNLVKGLKDNFDITIVLPRRGPLETRIKKSFDNVTVKTIPLSVMVFSMSPIYHVKFVLLTVYNILYFIRYVISNRIDVLYSNNLHVIFPGIVARLTGRKHIWYVREFSGNNLVDSILGMFVRGFSDTIICQSKAVKSRLFPNNAADVLYEPLNKDDYKTYDLDTLRKEVGLPLESTVISVISRIHPLKGQFEFIEGMEKTLKTYRHIKVLIIGDTTTASFKNKLYKRRIEKFIDEKGLNNVILHGFREDIDKMLSLSDICVFPFKREEPFGIAVTEALALDKPTFYPRIGGLKEVYEIFEKGEDYSIEKVIKAATSNRTVRRDNLNIPDRLSFSLYREKILTAFNADG